MTISKEQLPNILEAALMSSGQPLSIDQMLGLFLDENQPSRDEIRAALDEIAAACECRGVELKQVSSGYRFQARQDYAEWIARLWEEKPPRYSRALLETLVLIAYRQPITRGEIEDVRGVSVSSHIVKTLLEREWVRVVGHRDVPGKPALYATTKQFLDYFNLKSLEELPTLQEIRDLDKINAELELDEATTPAATEENADEVQHEVSESEATDSETEVTDTEVAANAESADAESLDSEAAESEAQAHEEIEETAEEVEATAAEQDTESEITAEKNTAVEEHAAEEVAEDEQSRGEDAEATAEAEDEDAEEMLYADAHEAEDEYQLVDDAISDDAGVEGEAIDDKYADTGSTYEIKEPDESVDAVSDNSRFVDVIKT